MDAEQLATLIDRHAGPLALYASQWSSEADDIVQDAFIRLVSQEKLPDPPLPWLFTVVRNLALTDRRSHERRRRREAVAGRLRAQQDDVSWAAEIAEALEQLEAESREIVVARLWGNLTFEEIANLLNISASTAHRRYQESLAILRRLLEFPCTTK